MQAHLNKNGQLIATHVYHAKTFGQRLKGLMFRADLPQDHALLIAPCNSIHTFFMRFAIDALFLSADHVIVAIYPDLQPFRITKPIGQAACVLETTSGVIAAHDINIGDRLEFLS